MTKMFIDRLGETPPNMYVDIYFYICLYMTKKKETKIDLVELIGKWFQYYK